MVTRKKKKTTRKKRATRKKATTAQSPVKPWQPPPGAYCKDDWAGELLDWNLPDDADFDGPLYKSTYHSPADWRTALEMAGFVKPKPKPGRPKFQLDAKEIKTLDGLAACGCTNGEIQAIMGHPFSTIYHNGS